MTSSIRHNNRPFLNEFRDTRSNTEEILAERDRARETRMKSIIDIIDQDPYLHANNNSLFSLSEKFRDTRNGCDAILSEREQARAERIATILKIIDHTDSSEEITLNNSPTTTPEENNVEGLDIGDNPQTQQIIEEEKESSPTPTPHNTPVHHESPVSHFEEALFNDATLNFIDGVIDGVIEEVFMGEGDVLVDPNQIATEFLEENRYLFYLQTPGG
jgi:hypothetical protein